MEYKGKLVQYAGGGYDGCFWEWNFFYWDTNGVFHNLMTTGTMGVKNEKRAKELVEKKGYYVLGECEHIVCDMQSPTDKHQFAIATNNSLVASIARQVNDIENSDCLFAYCSDCDTRIYPKTDARFECDVYFNPDSSGDDCYCYECDSNHTCHNCGGWNTNKNYIFTDYCMDCSDKETMQEMLHYWHGQLLVSESDGNTKEAKEMIEEFEYRLSEEQYEETVA